MTRTQFRRYQLIQEIIDGQMTINAAAEILGLSPRQVKRLKKGVELDDAAALIHGNSGRRPANAIPDATIARVLELKQDEKFKHCNFKHFQEILDEHYNIQLSYSSLHSLLKNNGIVSPKKRRRYKPHRRRKRHLQAGLLVQTDATPFAWFNGDRKRYALHGAIDDATGQIVALYMTKNECLKGYFEMTMRMIENFGVPVSLYADRHTIFQSPLAGKVDINSSPNDTQLGRAFKELGIHLIAARSAQAKGRVERLWETLQSRLPVEFSMRRIRDLDTANEFLQEYIYQYNSQFAVEPENTKSLFKEPVCDPRYVLCIKELRSVDAGGVFSYGGKSYKVAEDPSLPPLRANTKVSVLVSDAFGIRVQYRENIWHVYPFVPPKRKKAVPKPPKPKGHPVPEGHPWVEYNSYGGWEDWQETRQMLERIFLKAY